MSNFAIVSFSGRIGKIQCFEVGQKKSLKVSFGVAVNKSRRVNNKWQQETIWIPCIAWGKLAEYLKNKATTGMPIAGNGIWHIESYQKQDGNQVNMTVVILSTVDLQTNGNSKSEPQTKKPVSQPKQPEPVMDDIPNSTDDTSDPNIPF